MSLKEIAARTNTSVSTVSRVLNHPEHNCHSPELAQKIWETARELHYLPNASAKNLRLGSSTEKEPMMVDIFLTRFDSMDQDLFFRELFQHIKEELFRQNCLLGEILHSVHIMALKESQKTSAIPYKSAEKVLSEKHENPLAFISRKKHTGLIILGKCPADIVPILKKRYSCLVGIDRNPTDYEYDEVICNGATAAEKAVEYLISLGHKNIAYIGDCTFESRYTGYYQTLLSHKIPLNYSNIHPSGQTTEEGCRIMDSIIHTAPINRPTAIFCANDCTAIGVLKSLRQNKKRGYLPSVISIDNIQESQKTIPMLTTIDIPKEEMAHLALTALLDRWEGRHSEYLRIELPCRLIERESCHYFQL